MPIDNFSKVDELIKSNQFPSEEELAKLKIEYKDFPVLLSALEWLSRDGKIDVTINDKTFSIPRTEMDKISVKGKGNFGRTYAFQYTGNNSEIKKAFKEIPPKSNNHWRIAKFADPNEILKEQKVAAELSNKWHQRANATVNDITPYNTQDSASINGISIISGELEAYDFDINNNPISSSLDNFLGKLRPQLTAYEDLDITLLQILTDSWLSLKAINDAGILHLDPATRNIMLTSNKTETGDNEILKFNAKMIDYGFAIKKDLNGTATENKNIHPPLYSVDHERYLNLAYKDNYAISDASDRYAYKASIFHETIATLLMSDEDYKSHPNVMSFLFNENKEKLCEILATNKCNETLLKHYNQRVESLLENNIELPESTKNQIKTILDSFHEYITTPASEDVEKLNEDNAAFYRNAQHTFLNILTNKINAYKVNNNKEKLDNAINKLKLTNPASFSKEFKSSIIYNAIMSHTTPSNTKSIQELETQLNLAQPTANIQSAELTRIILAYDLLRIEARQRLKNDGPPYPISMFQTVSVQRYHEKRQQLVALRNKLNNLPKSDSTLVKPTLELIKTTLEEMNNDQGSLWNLIKEEQKKAVSPEEKKVSAEIQRYMQLRDQPNSNKLYITNKLGILRDIRQRIDSLEAIGKGTAAKLKQKASKSLNGYTIDQEIEYILQDDRSDKLIVEKFKQIDSNLFANVRIEKNKDPNRLTKSPIPEVNIVLLLKEKFKMPILLPNEDKQLIDTLTDTKFNLFNAIYVAALHGVTISHAESNQFLDTYHYLRALNNSRMKTKNNIFSIPQHAFFQNYNDKLAVVAHIASFENEPTKKEIADRFQHELNLIDYYYDRQMKEGGANQPGPSGGVYKQNYFVKSTNEIKVQRILFKQDTETDVFGRTKVNHHKVIGEYLTGALINELIGDTASRTIFAKEAKSGTYIGSIYLDEFKPLHSLLYDETTETTKDKYKSRNPLMEFSSDVQADIRKHLFNINPETKKLEPKYKGLEEIMAASLLTGDFDIHLANIGTAKVNGETRFVKIDHGAGLRNLEDAVHIHSHRRHLPGFGPANHFRDFPREFRLSLDFAKELEKQSNADLTDTIKNSTEMIDKYYGIEPIATYAMSLKIDVDQTEMMPNKDDYKKILVDKIEKKLLEIIEKRQTSLKQLAVEIRLSNYLDEKSNKNLKELIEANPRYFFKGDFHLRGRHQRTNLVITQIPDSKLVKRIYKAMQEKSPDDSQKTVLQNIIDHAIEDNDTKTLKLMVRSSDIQLSKNQLEQIKAEGVEPPSMTARIMEAVFSPEKDVIFELPKHEQMPARDPIEAIGITLRNISQGLDTSLYLLNEMQKQLEALVQKEKQNTLESSQPEQAPDQPHSKKN